MLDEENNIFIHNDEIIRLGTIETSLLSYLIARRYVRTTAEQISKKIYGASLDKCTKDAVTTLINKLNKKLKGILKIQSKFRLGYRVIYVEQNIK